MILSRSLYFSQVLKPMREALPLDRQYVLLSLTVFALYVATAKLGQLFFINIILTVPKS